MKVDRDFVPVVLIAALVVVWLSAKPWEDATAIAIAGDILKVGLGGVLGYMTKGMGMAANPSGQEARMQELEMENAHLRAQINGSRNYDNL
jgi:hypothetical protein